jgi:hypothetical protein
MSRTRTVSRVMTQGILAILRGSKRGLQLTKEGGVFFAQELKAGVKEGLQGLETKPEKPEDTESFNRR